MTEVDGMNLLERRFMIRWDAGAAWPCYRVSIPNFDGGEVVMAEDYDALSRQLAGAVSALRDIESELAHLFATYGDDTPGWEINRVRKLALDAIGGSKR